MLGSLSTSICELNPTNKIKKTSAKVIDWSSLWVIYQRLVSDLLTPNTPSIMFSSSLSVGKCKPSLHFPSADASLWAPVTSLPFLLPLNNRNKATICNYANAPLHWSDWPLTPWRASCGLKSSFSLVRSRCRSWWCMADIDLLNKCSWTSNPQSRYIDSNPCMSSK